MNQKTISDIENSIRKHIDLMKKASDSSDMEKLLRIIHNPGWTTPAESFLVKEIINLMNEHGQLLHNLKQSLMNGSSLVTKQMNAPLKNIVKVSSKKEGLLRDAESLTSSVSKEELVSGFPSMP